MGPFFYPSFRMPSKAAKDSDKSRKDYISDSDDESIHLESNSDLQEGGMDVSLENISKSDGTETTENSISESKSEIELKSTVR